MDVHRKHCRRGVDGILQLPEIVMLLSFSLVR